MHEFTVEDTFLLTGRGLVAVGEGRFDDLRPGTAYRAEVRTPAGATLWFPAYKEWLLIRTSPVVEREAFWLKGATRDDVPVGSTVRILVPDSP